MKIEMKKILLLNGLFGPIIFSFVLYIIGYYMPNYNHITQYMSELGAVNAPYALFINIFGFSIIGINIILFSLGLDDSIENNNSLFKYKFPILLLTLSGFSFILLGIFPCDPNCMAISIIGKIHGIFAGLAQFLLIFGVLFLKSRFENDSNWKKYSKYTLVIGILSLFLAILYKSNVFSNHIGLMQRISFGLPLLWIELTSIKSLFNKKFT